MAEKCYEGGLPMGGVNLFPKVSNEGEQTGVYGGEMKMSFSKTQGGSMSSGFTGKGDFLSSSGYHATGEERASLSPKIVNPDDIKK